jgi:hypothetical protein
MSFRLFIYYCAVCGGGAAFVGWAIGRFFHTLSQVPRDGIRGLFLGLMIALGLSLVDCLWNLSLKQVGQVAMRVLVAVVVGCFGGLIGGMLGSVLYVATGSVAFVIFGWTLTGFLVGASVGIFEILSSLVYQRDMSGSTKKVVNGVLGGTLGGVLGGFLFVLLNGAFTSWFKGKDADILWSPSSMGFVALGACIGLLIGLAQVILMEAWIKVEAGFRAGREKILNKGELTIGRAEACDIGLFGDNTIERLHAKIAKRGNNYYLLDNNTPAGTYLNGNRIARPELLQTGDAIKVGNCLLRFGERQKRRQLQGM